MIYHECDPASATGEEGQSTFRGSVCVADPHLKTFQMKKHSYYRYRVQVSAKRFRVMLQEYKFNYSVLK